MTDIINRISALCGTGTVPVAGIDGLGGAGKSTISEKFTQALTAAGYHVILLHIDDLIHERAVRYNSAYPEWQCYYDLQWRYDHFREVIGKLRRGESTDVTLYDKDNDSFFTEHLVPRKDTIVLTEGIFLQRPELSGVFDLMIYIDIPRQERLKRVLARDTYIGDAAEIEHKYRTRYFPAEEHYLAACRPREKADVLL